MEQEDPSSAPVEQLGEGAVLMIDSVWRKVISVVGPSVRTRRLTTTEIADLLRPQP